MALYKELLPLAKRVLKQADRAIAQVRQRHFNNNGEMWLGTVEHYRDLIPALFAKSS